MNLKQHASFIFTARVFMGLKLKKKLQNLKFMTFNRYQYNNDIKFVSRRMRILPKLVPIYNCLLTSN